jgi:hypothetical protein
MYTIWQPWSEEVWPMLAGWPDWANNGRLFPFDRFLKIAALAIIILATFSSVKVMY